MQNLTSTKFILLLIIPLLFILQACPPFYGYKYNEGWLQTRPVNMLDINSEYDDYNLTAPEIGDYIPLLFSSNRESYGEQFDIIYKIYEIWFDKSDGTISTGVEINDNPNWAPEFRAFENVPSVVNTLNDEFGPFIKDYYLLLDDPQKYYYRKYILLYASAQDTDLDIFVTGNDHPDNDTLLSFYDPVEVNFLNSDYNDAYATIDIPEKKIFFCSDRDGSFDIFCCHLPKNKDIIESILDSSLEPGIEQCLLLSSDADDKCPYIDNNIMVFASNRPGGYGGFDLWYSEKNDTSWTAPINFGENVNSEFDEFRPMIRNMPEFKHNLLMFSSNRPNGKGGFDLYYVGVKKLITTPTYY